jgi:hypothetical protein
VLALIKGISKSEIASPAALADDSINVLREVGFAVVVLLKFVDLWVFTGISLPVWQSSLTACLI